MSQTSLVLQPVLFSGFFSPHFFSPLFFSWHQKRVTRRERELEELTTKEADLIRADFLAWLSFISFSSHAKETLRSLPSLFCGFDCLPFTTTSTTRVVDSLSYLPFTKLQFLSLYTDIPDANHFPSSWGLVFFIPILPTFFPELFFRSRDEQKCEAFFVNIPCLLLDYKRIQVFTQWLLFCQETCLFLSSSLLLLLIFFVPPSFYPWAFYWAWSH